MRIFLFAVLWRELISKSSNKFEINVSAHEAICIFDCMEKQAWRIIYYFCKLLGKQLVSIIGGVARRVTAREVWEPTSRPPNNQYIQTIRPLCTAHQRTAAHHTNKKEGTIPVEERERINLATHLFISFASQPYNVFPQSISSGKVNELTAADTYTQVPSMECASQAPAAYWNGFYWALCARERAPVCARRRL